VTAVCYQRQPFLATDDAKALFLQTAREVKQDKLFRMVAYVVLDDHCHLLLDPGVANISEIMQSLKLRFTHRIKKARQRRGNLAVWQRRFWDHIIRDENDLRRHLDYVHYNPVKHGYVSAPAQYAWSSFREYVARGAYDERWGASEEPSTVADMERE
jgi:putative transposase